MSPVNVLERVAQCVLCIKDQKVSVTHKLYVALGVCLAQVFVLCVRRIDDARAIAIKTIAI